MLSTNKTVGVKVTENPSEKQENGDALFYLK